MSLAASCKQVASMPELQAPARPALEVCSNAWIAGFGRPPWLLRTKGFAVNKMFW